MDQPGLTSYVIEHKIDLKQGEGSGKNGTFRKRDYQHLISKAIASNSKDKLIEVNYALSGDGIALQITDHIGMPAEAFLYVGIPFLSTKTASEIVTGEMGSGFFNVYRESRLVVIDSTLNGVRRVSRDTPVEKEGRVVDIKRCVSITKDDKRKNGTNYHRLL